MIESGGERRVRLGLARVPFLVQPFPARADLAPFRKQIVRHGEGRPVDAEILFRARFFVLAQGFAVRLCGARLGGRAVTDDGVALDQNRPVGGLRRQKRLAYVLSVKPVAFVPGPACRLEAAARVGGIGQRGWTVDGNAIVVVKHDELRQLQMTGQ